MTTGTGSFEREQREREQRQRQTKLCSFCAKTLREVKALVAGPADIFICDECIGLCVAILNDSGHEVPAVRFTDVARLELALSRFDRAHQELNDAYNTIRTQAGTIAPPKEPKA